MASTGTRRRSNSLTLFNRKKQDKNHKLHIAAALVPTQAFAIAPAVRCAEPTQLGFLDARFSKLNRTAISNSLVRRSLDKSLDQKDLEEMQQLSLRSATIDDSFLPQRRAPERSSGAPYDTSAVNAAGQPSNSLLQTNDDPEGKVIRVSIDPIATSAPLRRTAGTDPGPSGFIDEEVVVKQPRKAKVFTAPTTTTTTATRADDYTDYLPAAASGNAPAETPVARPRKSDSALRSEVKVLQDTVQRLSVELSRYQAAVAIQSGEVERYLQVNKVRAALSPSDPLPVWLIDQKYLSPLFASYDALIKDKDRLLKESKERMEEFEMRLHKAVKANPLTGGVFSTQIVPASAVQNGVPNNWPEIVRQCKYVIDENAQLKTTVDRQAKEINALEKCHVLEVSKLQDQLKIMEQEHLRTHSLLKDLLDRHRALEEATRKSNLSDQVLADAQKNFAESKAADQTQARLKQAEAALTDAMAKHTELLNRAKGFAQSIVRLSSENKLLQDEKAQCEKRLSKLKHKATALQGRLSHLQLRDSEKNTLLKDLISITDDISKQRNELAASLARAASFKSQMQERDTADKDLKLKWLEAMLQNSVDRIDQEETERRKLEQNVHAVWETFATRDRGSRGRLSTSGSSVLLRNGAHSRERSPSRPTSVNASSNPNRFDSSSLRNSNLFSNSLRLD